MIENALDDDLKRVIESAKKNVDIDLLRSLLKVRTLFAIRDATLNTHTRITCAVKTYTYPSYTCIDSSTSMCK